MDGIDDLTYSLKKANQLIRNRLDAGLKDLGLTTPQYSLLNELELSPGLSNAGLARKCFVTAQTMNVILLDLEKKKLVIRAGHPTNRKEKTTSLSHAGIDLVLQARGIVEDVETSLYQRLNGDEKNTLISILAKIGPEAL
jgi:DNA-binding MarR family transcriptional regulator